MDPQLKALLVLSDAGVATLHGEGEEGRPLPLALMGEGMNRLISLILAIGNAPGGVVLIDQIENGLHYSVLPNMWRAVGVAARLFNTQVFATTHSYECITAAQAAFAENRDDALRLYRLERQGDDLRTIGIDAAQLATVVEMGWEVR